MSMARLILRFLFMTAIAATVIWSSPAPAQSPQFSWSGVERIVAVGDLHGDFDKFVGVLKTAGLVGRRNKWTGGRAHLVQLGDVPDRGPDSRKILDLLMKLEKQAARAGGHVHALIGNHEAMNMYNDVTYVHAGEFAAFRSPKSRKSRDKFYDYVVRILTADPPEEGLPEFDKAYRKKWNQDHPLGFVEHRLAWKSYGKYGKWVMGHNAVIRINDILFLHGGISPEYVQFPLPEINDRVRARLGDLSNLWESILTDEAGPLWYRGLALNDAATEGEHVKAVLERYGVKRIVIGHTPLTGAVYPRFGGAVILADVGLASFYGSRDAFLVIEDGTPFAVHRGTKLPLPASREDVLAYLKQAAALDPEPSPVLTRIKVLEASKPPEPPEPPGIP